MSDPNECNTGRKGAKHHTLFNGTLMQKPDESPKSEHIIWPRVGNIWLLAVHNILKKLRETYFYITSPATTAVGFNGFKHSIAIPLRPHWEFVKTIYRLHQLYYIRSTRLSSESMSTSMYPSIIMRSDILYLDEQGPSIEVEEIAARTIWVLMWSINAFWLSEPRDYLDCA